MKVYKYIAGGHLDEPWAVDVAPGRIVHSVIRMPRFPGEIGSVTVWIEHVNPDAPKQKLTLQVYGTGHEIPPLAHHLTTAFDGPFVWHAYVLPTPIREVEILREQMEAVNVEAILHDLRDDS